MNNQQIFDHVKEFFLKQGKPSINIHAAGGGTCKYKTSDGLKCAVGCLIPDDKYTSSIEGYGVALILRDTISPNSGEDKLIKTLKSSGISKRSFPLLEALQDAHDSCAFKYSDNFINLFLEALEKVAKDFRLKYAK